MKRNLALLALTGVGVLVVASTSQAQVFVRAPFVRVQVGGGVYVRAPFVNLWVPPPVYYAAPGYYYGEPNVYVPPMPRVVESPPSSGEPQRQLLPAPQGTPLPATPLQPAPNNDNSPPQPSKAVKVPTLEEFAGSFQPKGGSYELSIVSPVTKQVTPVRFTLPEGTPRRVQVRRNEIEFNYGIRHFVRIEFDSDGAIVTSR